MLELRLTTITLAPEAGALMLKLFLPDPASYQIHCVPNEVILNRRMAVPIAIPLNTSRLYPKRDDAPLKEATTPLDVTVLDIPALAGATADNKSVQILRVGLTRLFSPAAVEALRSIPTLLCGCRVLTRFVTPLIAAVGGVIELVPIITLVRGLQGSLPV